MIALLADIHANLPALEAVLEDMPEVSAVWVLGDMAGELPYPCEVMDRLADLAARVPVAYVAGNRELSLLEAKAGGHPDWWESPQFRAMAWTADELKPHHWESLETMPALRIVDDIPEGGALFHGAPGSVRGKIREREEAESAASGLPQRWLACGHTHNARLFRVGRQTVVNAGSVGLPLDGVGGVACYALLDEACDACSRKGVVFRQVAYDVEKTVNDLQSSGLSALAPGITRAVALELITGRHHMMGLVEFCGAYAKRALGAACERIPAALWIEAESLWDGSEWRRGRFQ